MIWVLLVATKNEICCLTVTAMPTNLLVHEYRIQTKDRNELVGYII